eukprot:766523-Hanusia_phi.AAC.3
MLQTIKREDSDCSARINILSSENVAGAFSSLRLNDSFVSGSPPWGGEGQGRDEIHCLYRNVSISGKIDGQISKVIFFTGKKSREEAKTEFIGGNRSAGSRYETPVETANPVETTLTTVTAGTVCSCPSCNPFQFFTGLFSTFVVIACFTSGRGWLRRAWTPARYFTLIFSLHLARSASQAPGIRVWIRGPSFN